MSWEAFRLTSKSPSELLTVMGPAGVDHLVRDALMACWRSLPEADRTFDNWRQRVEKLWRRNMAVWTRIRKPSPEAFFTDLAPYESDGFFRQALVLTWMMLPRASGRSFKDTFAIIRRVFDRNVAAWQTDHATFSPAKPKARVKRSHPKRATTEHARTARTPAEKAPRRAERSRPRAKPKVKQRR